MYFLSPCRAQVKDMFFFGFDGYMKNAYPADELRPISCQPRERPDGENNSTGIDLVLGRYQLTLIDSLDTMYIMGEKELWRKYVNQVIETAKFDSDLDVSVFEASIRILGSLLSNHLFAVKENLDYEAKELLRMSTEVANRLIPAFLTPSGLPVGKVNLRYGVPQTQSRDVCTACAGTFMLEFGLLSKLTGDDMYAEAAQNALIALDQAATKSHFMGAQINVDDSSWSYAASGVGAGIDSLYEYLIKSYVLFGDEYYYTFFSDIYARVMAATRIEDVHLQAHIQTGELMATWTDSLGAFWPGMQVLVGDIAHAQSGFIRFWDIWRKYGIGLPERFDVVSKQPIDPYHHLRPELIESAYMLWGATKDPFYIHTGAEMMKSYEKHAKVACGYATIKNVSSKEKEDKMESFFLAETLKYLYLLFTPDHWMNKENYVFTTEAHPIPVDQKWRKKDARVLDLGPSSSICVAQESCSFTFDQQICTYNNSLYLRASRPMGSRIPPLHFVLDGLKHKDVKSIGANILTSDREIFLTVSSQNDVQTYYAIRGAFGKELKEGEDAIIANLVQADPFEACNEIYNAEKLKDSFAVVLRGGCTFAEKAIAAEKAGAKGIVFINHQDTPIFTMVDDKFNPTNLEIPVILVSKDDGDRIVATMNHHIQSKSEILPSAFMAPAHPFNEAGVLQIVLSMNPDVPIERHPPVGHDKGNLALRFGDGYVIMSDNQADHMYSKSLEGSHFQVWVRNETAPFAISRAYSEKKPKKDANDTNNQTKETN